MNFKALTFQHVVKVLSDNPLTAKVAEALVGEKVDTETLKKAQGMVEQFVKRPRDRLATMAKRAERRESKKKKSRAKPPKAKKAKAKKTKKTKKAKAKKES